jgi:hypothetical protein
MLTHSSRQELTWKSIRNTYLNLAILQIVPFASCSLNNPKFRQADCLAWPHASCWFPACLIVLPLTLRRHVSLKCRLTFHVHGIYPVLKMEATCCSETSVAFETKCVSYVPEDRIFHCHSCGNLNSYIRWLPVTAIKLKCKYCLRPTVLIPACRNEAAFM